VRAFSSACNAIVSYFILLVALFVLLINFRFR